MIQNKEIGRLSLGYENSKGKLQKQINFVIGLSYCTKRTMDALTKKVVEQR